MRGSRQNFHLLLLVANPSIYTIYLLHRSHSNGLTFVETHLRTIPLQWSNPVQYKPSLPLRPYTVLTRLSSLPNELILEIAHHLTNTRDVYALLRVNTRLAVLLPQVLSEMLLHTYTGSTRHTLFDSTQHAESLVSRLASLSIDINATVCHCAITSLPDCRCEPPLHRAITHSNRHMVAALLRHGASINTRCYATGNNAVHHAIDTADWNSGPTRIAREIDLVILRMLLGGGRLSTMNTPAALNSMNVTWLNMAVSRCPPSDVRIVMPLLAHGLDLNVTDDGLCTPLHTAVLRNHTDLAKMLLEHGADHRTVDQMGVTPFATACDPPNCEMIDLLLSHDAGLIREVVNRRGETAEICLQRTIDEWMLSGDRESVYFEWEISKRTLMVRKLRQLACASRHVDAADVKEAGAHE